MVEARRPCGGRRRARKAPSERRSEEHRALTAWSCLRLGAPRDRPRALRRGTPRNLGGERAGAASGIAGAAEGRADVHERLSEIASPAAWRQRARCRGKFATGAGDRLFHSKEPRQNAGDIAVDGRGLAAKRDRCDRGRGIGANARKRAQLGFLAWKCPASSRDFLGAGVQVPRSGIIAETRERAHHGFDGRRCQILDPRPFGNEGLIIGRRRLRCRLLQQHFGEPDPVGIGRFPWLRAPGERAAVAVPPCKRTGDNRLSLCLGR